jgi:hypothetical protein
MGMPTDEGVLSPWMSRLCGPRGLGLCQAVRGTIRRRRMLCFLSSGQPGMELPRKSAYRTGTEVESEGLDLGGVAIGVDPESFSDRECSGIDHG